MLQPGTTIGGYRVERAIGSGGMGVVYEATQLSLERTVALKVLATQLSGDPTFCERFRREAMLQAALDHPHIDPVYEAGEADGAIFLAMRLVRGPNLKQLALDGKLEPPRAVEILADVASALDTAHGAGLIHRDIKPQNILVDGSGHAYLADFGLTKAAHDAGVTGTGVYLGSLDYVSPEQIQHKPLTASSDLYAFAAVLYEALSGEVPYPRDTEAAMLYAHLSEPPPRLTDRRAELPPALDAVVAKGLAKDPELRYASARELVAAARAAMNGGIASTADFPPARARDGAAARGPAAERRRSGDTIVDPAVLREPPVLLEPDRRRAAVPRAAVWTLLALVPLAALAGYALGNARERDQPRVEGVAAAGPLTLGFPPSWAPLAPRRPIPGLRLADPIALARRDGGEELRAGLAIDAEGALVLPPAFRRELVAPPRPETVRLRSLDALRYRALRHRDVGVPLTLFVVPTDRGAATVACLGAPRTADSCESIAATLSLRGTRARGLLPSPAYGRTLRRVVTRLERVRRPARTRLRAARAQRAQVTEAARLAAAYRAARRAAAGARPGLAELPAHRALVDALDSAAAAHAALARAARANDALAWDRSAANVRGAEDAVRRALRALTRLGYRIT